MINKVKTPGV